MRINLRSVWAWIVKQLTPKPSPPAPTPSGDAIALQSVVWLQGSPASFPVTAKLTGIDIPPGHPTRISWSWSHPVWRGNIWGQESASPEAVVGMMWVFARINGTWYAKGWEWLRPDTSTSVLENLPGEPPFIQSKAHPINNWYPQPGEEVGFMVSTITADWPGYAQGEPYGRSPVVVVRWP